LRTITEIEPLLLSAPHGDHPSHLPTGYRPASLVRIKCSDGTTGLGESYLGVYAPLVFKALIEHFSPYLIGEDPTEIPATIGKVQRQCLWWGWVGASISALSAVDIALWDIKGKIEGVPVYELLGGLKQERIELYASGGVADTKAALQREARGYLDEGYRAVKIRINRLNHRPAERTAWVRDAVGPDVKLMVDAVQSISLPPWTAEEAVRTGRELEPLRPFWFEEPCGSGDVPGYTTLRRSLNITIAGGESLTTAEHFQRFFEAEALGIAQPDATHVGGISECKTVCTLARNGGIPVALHAWGSAVSLAANYHVGFASPNCIILERPVLNNPLVESLLLDRFKVQGGFLHPPSAPGLGVKLDEAVTRQFLYRPGSAYQI
jgi:L-alanine-DL-glutamate epimerase-like enolase superfamily enzyme